jgi:hypothetical protein
MKKLAFATVSILALSVAAVEATTEQKSSTPMTPLHAATHPSHKAMHHAHHPKHAHKHHAHHAAHKHHGHKHHAHHAKHKHGHHMAQHEVAYVAFPPAQGCTPQYYGGATTCPYMYHGGYFWYPHAQANMLSGYTPYYANGQYWYASRMHPHMLYIDRQAPSYVWPCHMGRPIPSDAHMHANRPHLMTPSYEEVPILKPAIVN